MSEKRQSGFSTFLADHPVFSLEQLAQERGDGERRRAHYQIRHHLRTGRVKAVAREIFAAVPPGIDPRHFQPDRYLVANAARSEAVFAYHAALELLGAARSIWNECTVFCDSPRSAIQIGTVSIVFLETPSPLRRRDLAGLGVERIPHETCQLRVTGPERALVEGFRQPHRVGGVAEHMESTAGFPMLDFELLAEVLEAYAQKNLWAAVGWFVSLHRDRWSPPNEFLERCRAMRPRQKQYLLRDARGGPTIRDWNLILPSEAKIVLESHAGNP